MRDFRDEAPYLKEWIDYHRLLGVTHFYLFNDRSQDNFLEVLAPYIEYGIVDLEECSQKSGDTHFINQRRAYVRGINKALHVTTHVAFIDIDEFIVPKKHDTLPSFLEHYQNDLGVMIRWRKFGTSGYKQIPPRMLLTEALTRCSPLDDEDNQITKSIIQIAFLPREFFDEMHVKNNATDLVHFFVWENYDGKKARRKAPIASFGKTQILVDTDEAQINHYWCRDEKYYREKKVPRKAFLLHEDFNRPLKWSEEKISSYLEKYNRCTDRAIERFVQRLKEGVPIYAPQQGRADSP